jgi:succinate dehydrogenase/fumarate reductase cytochrome b subunit
VGSGRLTSDRLQRITGVALVATALSVVLGAVLGDPTIESHDDREKFVEQVENAADRIPVIYVFQGVEVVSGFLTLAAGLGLYLVLRERARVAALSGLLLFVVSCMFEAGRAFVGAGMIRAADDYLGGGLAGIGTRSTDVLELIRVLAVLHFGYFLSAFAALGLGAAAFAYGLAWPTGILPRWLGWLGLVAGTLLLLTPLAVTIDILFLPFFVGAILTVVWLLDAGLTLSLRRRGSA